MANLPRITMSLDVSDQAKLKRAVERLGLSSPGQLMRFLLSGDPDKIDMVSKALKELSPEGRNHTA